jgi:2-keto-4-pentenoate hydratase/2-oxohepta-3-ene-1,7-dioic acid hydratase in catechol pathway
MKWCRYTADGSTSYGIIDGETVQQVSGSPFGEHSKTGRSHALDSVKLEVPVIPPTFYAAGINYPEHVTWAAHMRGEVPNLPKKADVGYRANNALVPQGHDIVVPADATEELQYEGELVVVIGKGCGPTSSGPVSETDALDYVFGYTIGNDVSERYWQRNDRTMWRAKNTDTFKPMGPWIVTGLDPDDLHCKITLSGRVVGEYDVATAIFGVRTYISEMSRYMTLYPGDVLWMGTEGATENMTHGDVIEIEISGIGVLRNPVVREG